LQKVNRFVARAKSLQASANGIYTGF